MGEEKRGAIGNMWRRRKGLGSGEKQKSISVKEKEKCNNIKSQGGMEG